MEGDGTPKKKKSRFFSGGKSLFDNIQASLQKRHASSSSKASSALLNSPSSPSSATQVTALEIGTSSKDQETSFKDASDTFNNSHNKVRSSDIEQKTDDEVEQEHKPPRSVRISTAAASLQNLSLNKNATRRHGIESDAFQELTGNGPLPKTNLPDHKIGDPVGPSSTNPQPRLMFSATAPLTRRPPTPPAGSRAPPSESQGEVEHTSSRHVPRHSGSAHPTQRPSAIPNLHPQSQQLVPTRHEDPTKSYQSAARLRQPFLPRPLISSADDHTIAQRPRLIPNVTDIGITNLPLHSTLTPNRRPHVSTISPTLYTSPNRIPNAVAFSRKRKRAGIVLPPPAYIYHRTNSPSFNIFPAILLYPELCFHLSTHLPLSSLISLYAISRDFHTILDSRFTTVILSQSLAKAPESSRIFPFRCYAHLCRRDPTSRIPHPDPLKAAQGISRAVPSFRWLRMIFFREKVVAEIMSIMAEDGVPLPSRCSLAMKRMWFILDIPDNARRIGFIHSNTLVPDLCLYFMMCLFVKLDMRFNDPAAQNVYHGFRKMVLAQRSLSFLLKVLRREELRSQFEVLKCWVRTRYVPAEDEVGMDIFGFKGDEVGKGRYEYWGKKTAKDLGRDVQVLLRPEQLVMREAVRRGLRLQKHFLRSLLYGYIRPDTLENYVPRDLGRRVGRLWDEYEVDDEIGGEMVSLVESARDTLLDLGESKEVSVYCVKEDRVEDSDQVARRIKEEAFLNECMRWSSDARQWECDFDGMDLD